MDKLSEFVKISEVNLPSVLEPDHNLALGQAQRFGQLPSFLLAEKTLLHESCFQLRQLPPRKHGSLKRSFRTADFAASITTAWFLWRRDALVL